MKIAALLLALVITLTTTSSCGESTEVQYDEPKVAVEEVTIPEPEPDPSKYDGITNIFVSPLEDIDIDLRAEDVNIYQYNASWDDETNQYALRMYVFHNDEMYYGVIANEDLSRSAVAWIDIRNPDKTEFNKLLNTLDWHPEEYPYGESDIPYGYISTEDSAIILMALSIMSSIIPKKKCMNFGISIHLLMLWGLIFRVLLAVEIRLICSGIL